MSQYSAITKPNRINWGEQEYASQGKEGAANRCHPLQVEEMQLPEETKFCAWPATTRNIIPLEAVSPQAMLCQCTSMEQKVIGKKVVGATPLFFRSFTLTPNYSVLPGDCIKAGRHVSATRAKPNVA